MSKNRRSRNSDAYLRKKQEDKYEQSIKNLEVLYNQAFQLNRLYKVKDYMLNSPTLRQKINNLEKWQIIKNLCMIILLTGNLILLFF